MEITWNSIPYPLLSSVVFAPPLGVYDAGNLTTIELLLKNGYTPVKERRFFPRLMEETWFGKLPGIPDFIPDESLHKIIRLALDYGANPMERFRCSDIRYRGFHLGLHLAPPQLVGDLIRHGAEPSTVDGQQHTPLDWVIQPDTIYAPQPRDWGLKRRYDTCNLLLRHGGTCNQGEQKLTLSEVNNLLEEFKGEGYDVEFLTARLSEMPGLADLREYGVLGAQFGEAP